MLCEPVMANTDGLRNETAPLSGVRAVQIWPWLLAGFAAAAMVALAFPLRLPLGSFYWDLVVYLDAFQRIRTGQAPALDFFAPVGPLGYYLGYAIQRVFPNAQPLLLTNWALMPVLLPLVAAILSQRGASRHALALLLPFLIFVALPINLFGYYPSPGLDGYGIYNRHTATLLYWLAATLIFVEGPRARTALGRDADAGAVPDQDHRGGRGGDDGRLCLPDRSHALGRGHSRRARLRDRAAGHRLAGGAGQGLSRPTSSR